MKKYLLTLLLLLATITCLVACGSDENPKNTDVDNPVKDQTVVDVPNDTDEPEVPVENPDSEVVTEEPVDPEEPVVNMVDFETWAKQKGNEDVCLVIWNEELGNQEVMIPSKKTLKAYEVKEGDRFAIPYRENIFYENELGESKDTYYAFK